MVFVGTIKIFNQILVNNRIAYSFSLELVGSNVVIDLCILICSILREHAVNCFEAVVIEKHKKLNFNR